MIQWPKLGLHVVLTWGLVSTLHADVVVTIAGDGSERIGPKNGRAVELSFGQPFGLAIGPDGHLYECEISFHRVRKIDLRTGLVHPWAGAGDRRQGGYTGDSGLAVNAQLNEPYEIAFDSHGNTYFVEMPNHNVRRVDPKGIITTIVGNGKPGFSGDDGPAIKAQLKQPHSIAVVGPHLYIADIGNHRIRSVNLNTGIITTIAGNGDRRLPQHGTIATNQPIFGPRALASAPNGLWIALREGHSIWHLNLDSRKISHIAGNGKPGFTDGKGREAQFNGPKGIAVGPEGKLYIADTENHALRRVDPTSQRVETIAGGGPKSRGFAGDGGPGAQARFDRPHGVCVGPDGAVYIGDSNNHRIRRWAP
jgi:streptogramin lyase